MIESLKEKKIVVNCICTDGSTTMKKARKIICNENKKIVNIRCCAHLLNLVLKDILNIQNFHSAAKNAVELSKFFTRSSAKYYPKLKELQIAYSFYFIFLK